jgi:hypothetical protein
MNAPGRDMHGDRDRFHTRHLLAEHGDPVGKGCGEQVLRQVFQRAERGTKPVGGRRSEHGSFKGRLCDRRLHHFVHGSPPPETQSLVEPHRTGVVDRYLQSPADQAVHPESG